MPYIATKDGKAIRGNLKDEILPNKRCLAGLFWKTCEIVSSLKDMSCVSLLVARSLCGEMG